MFFHGGEKFGQMCAAMPRSCDQLVLTSMASAKNVLTDDELELGVGIVDIGSGLTNFSVVRQDILRHNVVIPIAGDHVTKDLAVALRTPIREAEQVKSMQ